MSSEAPVIQSQAARVAGAALLLSIVVGVVTVIFVTAGIDINLSADVEAVAINMLDAEQRLRAKAYLAILTFLLEVTFSIAILRVLFAHGAVLASVSAISGIAAALCSLIGGMAALTIAELLSVPNTDLLATEVRLNSIKTLITGEYTTFHMGVIIGSLGKAGVFFLLLTSRLVPTTLAGWGVFASLFVATTVVARDFIGVLANNSVTMAFILCNLIALVSLSLYLTIRGIRVSP
ncbi:MAG: DUF4386 family protein [Pseudomonadota bacterium]